MRSDRIPQISNAGQSQLDSPFQVGTIVSRCICRSLTVWQRCAHERDTLTVPRLETHGKECKSCGNINLDSLCYRETSGPQKWSLNISTVDYELWPNLSA